MKDVLKKIKFKPLLVTVSLIAIQTTLYFISKLFQGQPHLIGNFIDEVIPFNSLFIIPYYLWYALIFIVPYYLFLKDKDMFYKYIICYVFTALISNTIFLFYPTMVIRPEIEVTNITTFLTNFIYIIDNPAINCFPSLHCAISMLFILTSCTSKKINNKFKIFIFFMSVLVMLSTLFTKQHVFVDLVSGDIIALIVFIIFRKNKIIVNKMKELLKI